MGEHYKVGKYFNSSEFFSLLLVVFIAGAFIAIPYISIQNSVRTIQSWLTIIFFLAYAAGIGAIASFICKICKIHSATVAVPAIVIGVTLFLIIKAVMTVSVYYSPEGSHFALFGELISNPKYFFGMADGILKDGYDAVTRGRRSYSRRTEFNVSGGFLAFIWFVEIVLTYVIVIAIARARYSHPYSENTNSWIEKKDMEYSFRLSNPQTCISEIENNPAMILDYPRRAAIYSISDSAPFTTVRLYISDDEQDCYISVYRTSFSTSRKHRGQKNQKLVIKYLRVDMDLCTRIMTFSDESDNYVSAVTSALGNRTPIDNIQEQVGNIGISSYNGFMNPFAEKANLSDIPPSILESINMAKAEERNIPKKASDFSFDASQNMPEISLKQNNNDENIDDVMPEINIGGFDEKNKCRVYFVFYEADYIQTRNAFVGFVNLMTR